MITLGLAVLAAVLAWSAGSDRARLDRAEADRDGHRGEAEALRSRLAALGADSPGNGAESHQETRADPGSGAWLFDALSSACAELLPGEQAVAVTVQALADGAVVLVAVTDDMVPLRSVMYPADEDGECVFEEIELPEPCDEAWLSANGIGDDGEEIP